MRGGKVRLMITALKVPVQTRRVDLAAFMRGGEVRLITTALL